MSEKKVFKKYLAKYFLIVFFVILCCIPFGAETYRYIREYTVAQNAAQLREKVRNLDSQISKMHIITSMIKENASLLELKRVQGELPGRKHLQMQYVKDHLYEIHHIYDMSPMSFLVFADNPIFVSGSHVDADYYNYYGKFLSAEGMDAEQFRSLILSSWEKSPYIPVDGLSYNGFQQQVELEHAVLYVEALNQNLDVGKKDAFIVYIIDGETWTELLLPDEYQDSALLHIEDSFGNTVLTYGSSYEQMLEESGDRFAIDHVDYYKQQYTGQESGLIITAGFPLDQIQRQMGYIIGLLLQYLLLGVCMALILTAGCTWHWFKPFKKVLKAASQYRNGQAESGNAYDYIHSSILELVSEKDEAELKRLLIDAEKQAIMLENVFERGFLNQQELQDFAERYSLEGSEYYVAVIHAEGGEEQSRQKGVQETVELFQKQHRRTVVPVYPVSDRAIVLAAVGEDIGDEILRGGLKAAAERVSAEQGISLVIGISRRQDDLCKISAARAQARRTVHVYWKKNRNYVEFYKSVYEGKKSCFHASTLRKLSDLILCMSRREINGIFDEMLQETEASPEEYEFQKTEIYYGIQFMLHSVCQQMSVQAEGMEVEAELQNLTLKQCLELLRQRSMEICDKIEQKRDWKAEERKRQIQKYMEENFSRIELNADVAVDELGISEKYLYAYIKEQTGKTFAVYLEELRVAHARHCLECTDWSNEKIAQESGFGSANTFYRIFKKYTGVSPSVYRKSL